AQGYVGDGDSCGVANDCPEACNGNGTGDVANAVCQGDPGNRGCSCAPGYSGDPDNGDSCTQINESDDNNGGRAGRDSAQPERYRCRDLRGGYFCDCETGYERNSAGRCVNVDECARGSSLCHPNAICTDTDGSYECECKAGFTGDGHVCRDFDECQEGE